MWAQPPGHANNLSAIEARYQLGGFGREAFYPRLFTGLLIYAYCVGVRSSRQIERLCLSDSPVGEGRRATASER